MADEWDDGDEDADEDLHISEEDDIPDLEPLSEGAGLYLDTLHDVVERMDEIPEMASVILDGLRNFKDKLAWGHLTPLASRIVERTLRYCGRGEKVKPRAGERWARRFREETLVDLSLMMAQAQEGELYRAVKENTSRVSGIFGLQPHEERLVLLTVACRRLHAMDNMMDAMLTGCRSWSRALSIVLRCSSPDAEKLACGENQIFYSGLMAYDGSESYFTNIFELRDRIDQIMERPPLSEAEIIAKVLVPNAETSLTLTDVEHFSSEIDLCRRVLEGAMVEKRSGINILLFGPPGTGKTEIAKLISGLSGASTYFIGEAQDGEVDLTREDRMADLMTAQCLLRESARSIVVFDEMEDMTVFDIGQGSKIIMNRILEKNAVPVIWISNGTDRIPDYLIRRMTLSFEVPVPAAKAQKRILKTLCLDAGLTVEDAEVDRLQAMSDVVPGLAQNMVRAVSLSGNKSGDMALAWSGIQQAMTGRKPDIDRLKRADVFRPELSLADSDIVSLAEKLRDRGAVRVSFCLSGPAGTGKSAYARYVTEAMGLRYIEKKGSDVFGSYVGETEQNIARAFEQAKDEGAALIFDEIDSLLTDRRTHGKSWETSQVNELLKALEDHPAPVFGCTNLVDNLDQAAMRRFLFKIQFKTLAQAQASRCWEHYFGAPAPKNTDLNIGLVPADFGIVKARSEFMDITSEKGLLDMLRAEAQSRGHKPMRIGFGRELVQ